MPVGYDQVNLFTAISDEPAFLISQMERSMPGPDEGCTKSQPWAPNVPPFAQTRAGVPQGYSEVYSSRHYTSMQPVPTGSADEYLTGQLEATRMMPTGADISPNGGSIYPACGDDSLNVFGAPI
ncbi:hypothetical protein BJY52DRAFT_1189035 [Lactarius psammicola]|nr:hypothetical protein BJY52DRAFT_1189035 [Lactarius psammicola]